MELWLNFGFAWISVILAVFLSVIYVFRIMGRKPNKFSNLLNKLNKAMRKHHKKIGILLVATGLIHGLFSSESVFSLNLGTISWIISILLGVNWMVRKYLARFKGWIYYHRILTIAFLAIIVLHVIDVGGIQIQNVLFNPPTTISSQVATNDSTSVINDSTSLNSLNAQFSGAELKDGVYSGEATGFRPGLKVSVQIKSNSIISVEVTEHNEVNQRFYSAPINTIPAEIVQNQTLDVDTVSGATCTSVGIINAVKDALSKALISGELPADKELPINSGRRGH